MKIDREANKQSLLAGLEAARTGILASASALAAKDRDVVFLGSWTVKDLLAHLAGWDYTNLESARSILAGKLPDFYAQHDRDWRTYNAAMVAKYKCGAYGKLLASVKESRRHLVAFLQTIPADAFPKDFGVRFHGIRVTIQRLLEAEAEDEQVHSRQIRDFFRRADLC